MSVTMDLGKVGVLYKGVHDSAQTYERNDIVMSNGSGYIAKQNVPVGVDISNTSYWGTVVVGADSNVFATKAYTASTYATISDVSALQAAVGSPLIANAVADMTNTEKVYVYTGSEAGYTSGNWYYYNGSAWVSGGTYNSQAIGDGTITTAKLANGAVTDAKLAQSGGILEKVANLSPVKHLEFVMGGVTTGGVLFQDETTRTDRSRATTALCNVTKFTFTQNTATTKTVYVFFYDKNGNYISYTAKNISTNVVPQVITPPEGAKYSRVVTNITPVSDIAAIGLQIEIEQNPALTENDIILNTLNFVPTNMPYSLGATNQVCRLGWKPTAGNTPPIQSIPSYALAYQNDCHIMLADVRVTADGEYVCWHDENLANYVRHTDGSTLSNEEKARTIAGLTLSELDVYDFGIYKGAAYAGIKILRLKDFLKWCAAMNCWAFLEVKVALTASQIAEIASLIKRYKMSRQVFVGESYPTAMPESWISSLPTIKAVVMGGTGNFATCKSIAATYTNAGIESFISYQDTSTLTETMIGEANAVCSGLWYATDITSTSDLVSFYNGGWANVYKLISSSWVRIGEYLYGQSI